MEEALQTYCIFLGELWQINLSPYFFLDYIYVTDWRRGIIRFRKYNAAQSVVLRSGVGYVMRAKVYDSRIQTGE